MDPHPDDNDDEHQKECTQAVPEKHIAGRIYDLFHVGLLMTVVLAECIETQARLLGASGICSGQTAWGKRRVLKGRQMNVKTGESHFLRVKLKAHGRKQSANG